ncbi:MAG: twin-arginine translocation pathway signal protein [Rhodospirillales bacterium]|nr:twin-arginine translocation pathway signal protein [Rhodospirillales bacterium]
MQGATALAALGVTRSFAAASSRPPNILFILADDLGYADLGCYGHRDHPSPVLDQLAREGVRLTQAYANSAVCSATRTALITGRYQYRLPVGLEEPIPGYRETLGLPPSHPTLPSLLKRVGYRTSLIGKWHLGSPPNFGPRKSGYDHFFGFHPGAADYFSHRGKGPDAEKEPFGGLFLDDQPVQRTGYLTDLLADHAVKEINEGDSKTPFFLSLHFNAPHWPWEGPNDEAVSATLQSLRHMNGGSIAKYVEMVRSMDAAIGRVLQALGDKAENTIVVFTSDNGGERFSDMWPFTGQKGELLEGGLRIPALLRWPARIAPGSVTDQVAMSMDWLPTLAAAAGAEIDAAYQPDGENLLPVLTGQAASRARTLYWRYRANEQAAVRDGNWKYLKLAGHEYLFDVAADPHERADRKQDLPEIFQRLRQAHERWNATMLPYPEASYSDTPKGRQPDRY